MSYDMKSKDEDQSLRCLHCMNEVRCPRHGTDGLVRHIEEQHSDLFASTGARNRKNLFDLVSAPKIGKDSASEVIKLICVAKSPSKEKIVFYFAKEISERQWDIKLRKINYNQAYKKPKPKDYSPPKVRFLKCPNEVSCRKVKDCIHIKNRETSSKPKEFLSKPKESCLKTKDPLPDMTFRKKSYRSSVRHWSALDGRLFCPACSYKKRPIIKYASETNSGWYSWTICFLPCLMSSDNQEYLYCRKCSNFLGIYNREKNMIKPNKEYF
ncbi:uncharacterized protein LOC108110288 [Drosophila eugracilis]|uniref:uncharacterized protein LOC108110288 n=1 Tax=Drosophila eugracilis TaxID=29029 RepID=UPI0007E66B2B|nr:uncharacterized protein LOC108110288 [Drosophila eugracilis]